MHLDIIKDHPISVYMYNKRSRSTRCNLSRLKKNATEGLEEDRRCFTKASQDNAASVADYIHSMKYEANLSDN
ncbi:MAG: hypothetical protein WAZ77_04640 [Candidatus Nitrosopolaris sp.]|jgi:hypothetical protein